MCGFPRFAEVCRETTDLLLSEDSQHGPLPQTWRIYLGVLAAAEKRSQYYLSLLAEKFLTVHGNKEWLKGLEYAHPKLRRIGRLNLLLAHMPWQISENHIKELVRGEDGGGMDLELRWTMAEVVQACLILSFYHAKAAMALGWGIVPEPDLLGGTTKTFIEKGEFISYPALSSSYICRHARGTFRELCAVDICIHCADQRNVPQREGWARFCIAAERPRTAIY